MSDATALGGSFVSKSASLKGTAGRMGTCVRACGCCANGSRTKMCPLDIAFLHFVRVCGSLNYCRKHKERRVREDRRVGSRKYKRVLILLSHPHKPPNITVLQRFYCVRVPPIQHSHTRTPIPCGFHQNVQQ
jgi:hypothetical protein